MVQRSVIDYLENAAKECPEKCAYFDDQVRLSYGKLNRTAKSIATRLISTLQVVNRPIAIYMDKSPMMIAAFFGAVYSRNFYSPIDTGMPEYRLKLVMENLKPVGIITDASHYDVARAYCSHVFLIEEFGDEEIDETLISDCLSHALDTDPLYVLYTSGSTGVPKGVVVSHASLIDYVDEFCRVIPIGKDDVVANQAPFYFDASLIDIYCTLHEKATMGIVPLAHFSMPLKLLEYMEENKVTFIRWVPSALKIISMFKGFKTLKPSALKTVLFGAEAMPVKCYNYWYENLPDVTFIQIYGPTEITGVCTYFVCKRTYEETEIIPIGKAFHNSEVFLLDEDNRKVARKDVVGEICVKGTCLALGYYNAPEKTAEVFVQNPLNPYYPERIYRTGDLAKLNEDGDFVFISRKDYQIKHMGHRIELGEIEATAGFLPGIRNAFCVHDKEKDKIILYYESDSYDEEQLTEDLKKRLVRYMVPNEVRRVDKMPLLKNGKVDRMKLSEGI
ncbi:MAG: amino acid adenylation domain-containing protein [Lachnospiraceae bacterium]|nr:amino acid adenylation domain-containing protein [Lachnospiraceae bacterium]